MKKLPFKNFVYLAGVVSLIAVFFSLIIQKRLPPQIPLFYGLPQGEEQLISSWGLVIPGLFSFLIILINLAITSFLKDDFLKKSLAVASFVVSVFALITTLKIAFLVGMI